MKLQRLFPAIIAILPLIGGPSRAADPAEPSVSPNLRYYYAVPALKDPKPVTVDVCVYGATPAGFTAAIQASRMGKKAVLLEFGTHIGGLTTGGLTATDGGSAAGGIAREFYNRIGKQSGFTPQEAEKLMKDMLKEANVPLLFEHRLASVTKDGNRITSLKCENGAVFNAQMFIDGTYEGDLFAAAGVSFHLGREANSVYNETINGIQLNRKAHQFNKDIDPYITEGDPKSGLLWGISDKDPGQTGEGDKRIQAYNFRMQFEKGGLPFPKPNGYDAKRYELLLRYIKAGGGPGVYPHPGDNNNNGGFSTDHIGFNYEWPDGPEMGDPKAKRDDSYFHRLYELREKIYQDHVTYQIGLVYFLIHDERVPKDLREKIGAWGMARHSFQETGGWPHALYVREGRRLLSDFVMTEHHCRGQQVVEDSVGLAQYTMDSHNTQRYVAKEKNGKAVVRNEGDVQVGIPGPYPVAYRALVPKEGECANLFVPVCLSSSHIAYGSIRMEPVFMVLGQSSATAACMAIDAKIPVQKVDYNQLKERLLADKQILVWTGPKKQPGVVKAKLEGIVVDNDQAKLVGDWSSGHTSNPFVGDSYLHDGNVDKGKKTATFTIPIKEAGQYDVRIAYSALGNRATNVPVTVSGFKGEPKTVKIDQKKTPPIDKMLISVGKFDFEAGSTATIVISNAGTDGHVIVDAVQLVK